MAPVVYGAVAAEKTLAWALRVLWLAVPFVAGPPLAAALDGASTPVRTLASIGSWAVWAVVAIAMVVPRPAGLTAFRLAAPGALAACAAAAAGGHASVPALVLTAALTVGSWSAEVAALFANGAAYPNERRFPLRVPGPLLLGPLPLSWALTVAGAVAGPLLLAAGRWVPGAVAVVAGWPLAWVLGRSLHLLSRRWAVLVPAGIVLHDPMTLADPVLFQRQVIELLHPAPAGSDSLDLTQRSLGLALELLLTEKVPLVLVKPGDRQGETGLSARLLFTPARPGALLAAAADARINVATS